MLALINNYNYKVITFQHIQLESVEHLKIVIEGEFKEHNNNLDIEFCDFCFYGCKQLPRVINGNTEFLVYIYQPGDSELVVNCD